MPIYEYRCSSCAHQQEFLQRLSDATLTVCTACGKPTFRKMLTAAGFQLKGSGWYATDFRNSGAAPAKAADSKGGTTPAETGAAAAEGKSEAKAETKTDSKADTKTDSKAEGKSTTKADSGAKAPGPSAPAKP